MVLGVGELVGVGVVVGVDEVVGVVVGVGVDEYCPAVGWYWVKLLEAAVGETVGELDLVGCADAGAETDGPCEGPVVPRRCPPCELTASAVEADAATITAAAAATQAIRRRLVRCEGPAVPMPIPLSPVPLASAAVPGCVGSAGWLGGRGVLTPVVVGGPKGMLAGGGESPEVPAGSGEPLPRLAAARPGAAYRLTTSVRGGGSQSAASWTAPSSASRSPGVGRSLGSLARQRSITGRILSGRLAVSGGVCTTR